MGDLESLLLILSAIYLTDCAVWIRRGGVLFQNTWGKRWYFRHPGKVLGNARGALVLANPLPPFGTVLLSNQFPLSFSSTGVLSFTGASVNPEWRPLQQAHWLSFSDIQNIAVEDKTIFLNGCAFHKAPSVRWATQIAKLVQQLRSLPKASRVDAIWKAMEATFDVEAVRARYDAFQKHSKLLRILSHFLFVYLFVAAPFVIWLYGFRHSGLPIALALLAQTVTIAVTFRRCHRRLFPDGASDRFVPFLTMLLAPPTAIRATDVLAKHLVEEFHPLAAAQTFCSATDFERFAREVIRDLKYPMLPLLESAHRNEAQTEESFRSVILELAKRHTDRAGLSFERLLRPPQKTDDAHQSYCPRCHEQYVSISVVCGLCGQPVVAFNTVVPGAV